MGVIMGTLLSASDLLPFTVRDAAGGDDEQLSTRRQPMNLMEGLIEETNRCREVAKLYDAIPTGFIGAALIRQDIAFAEKAMGTGDVIMMLQAYEKLKAVEA